MDPESDGGFVLGVRKQYLVLSTQYSETPKTSGSLKTGYRKRACSTISSQGVLGIPPRARESAHVRDYASILSDDWLTALLPRFSPHLVAAVGPKSNFSLTGINILDAHLAVRHSCACRDRMATFCKTVVFLRYQAHSNSPQSCGRFRSAPYSRHHWGHIANRI